GAGATRSRSAAGIALRSRAPGEGPGCAGAGCAGVVRAGVWGADSGGAAAETPRATAGAVGAAGAGRRTLAVIGSPGSTASAPTRDGLIARLLGAGRRLNDDTAAPASERVGSCVLRSRLITVDRKSTR